VQKPYHTRAIVARRNKTAGVCGACSAIATTEALFQLEECVLIRKYCDKCLPDAEYEIAI
jgi:hypothetical protein